MHRLCNTEHGPYARHSSTSFIYYPPLNPHLVHILILTRRLKLGDVTWPMTELGPDPRSDVTETSFPYSSKANHSSRHLQNTKQTQPLRLQIALAHQAVCTRSTRNKKGP